MFLWAYCALTERGTTFNRGLFGVPLDFNRRRRGSCGALFGVNPLLFLTSFFCYPISAKIKSIFQPAFGWHSTQTLVKIYNKLSWTAEALLKILKILKKVFWNFWKKLFDIAIWVSWTFLYKLYHNKPSLLEPSPGSSRRSWSGSFRAEAILKILKSWIELNWIVV